MDEEPGVVVSSGQGVIRAGSGSSKRVLPWSGWAGRVEVGCLEAVAWPCEAPWLCIRQENGPGR